jgi:2-polyprenyl-3-methyl-5-hydroxy-6-metoxy-1,4-benzoquinol methylase
MNRCLFQQLMALEFILLLNDQLQVYARRFPRSKLYFYSGYKNFMKQLENTKESAWPKRAGLQFQPDLFFLKVVKGLEDLGAACPALGRIYSRFFYAGMLEREFAMSGLSPGMKALHVGCGPLPMTAMYLARKQIQVTAVDIEQDILKSADRVIRRSSLRGMITLARACGTRVDFSGFDAIWLSLHVRPMDKVIHQALKFMDPGARIIFRGASGILSRFYREISQDGFSENTEHWEVRQALGKKSVMLKKT